METTILSAALRIALLELFGYDLGLNKQLMKRFISVTVNEIKSRSVKDKKRIKR